MKYKFRQVQNDDENLSIRTNQNTNVKLSKKRPTVLIIIILIVTFLLVLWKLGNFNRKVDRRRRPDPRRQGKFPGDAMIDENGIIQADGNYFPSMHEEESLEVRCKYYKDIKSSNVTIKDSKHKFLMAVSTGTLDFQRRHLIRAYQISPYNNSYDITWRFFMGPPSPYYLKALQAENATFGDIVVIPDLVESRDNSRAIKPMEILTYVEKHMEVYKYVAKLDSDCFLYIPAFYDQFFNQTVQDLDFGLIALYVRGRFAWPQGAFEAFSWKLVRMLNKLYEFVPRTHWAEDLQMGWYLHDAHIHYTEVPLPEDRAYDFNVTWGVTDVAYNTVRVHEMKEEIDYIKIVKSFNANGINTTYIDEMRRKEWIFDY